MTNPFYNRDQTQWHHGDEMLTDRKATLQDAWHTWETGSIDCDMWDREDWANDIIRSDYFNDMPKEAFAELLYLIAKNRGSPQLTNLIKHTVIHINDTLES